MKKFSLEWWQSLPPEKTGKETEKLVETLLKKMNEKAGFSYHRLPDAKAARGFLAAQPADFVWWCWEGHRHAGGYLEVKATKHESRLAKDKVPQLPMLHKHALAGAVGLVLVHHYLLGKWRIIDAKRLVTGVPSWELSAFPLHDSAEAALEAAGFVL